MKFITYHILGVFLLSFQFTFAQDNLTSKLNYCAYENALLKTESSKLKSFTERQHEEIMKLKLQIFEYQKKIHKYQIDSINISKAPLALGKLAEFLKKENNKDQVVAIYKLLIDIYPNHIEAVNARKELRQMDLWTGKK